jgi:sugar lactone lactonase YvrE
MKLKSLTLMGWLAAMSLAIPAAAQTISTAAGNTTWGGPIDVAVDTSGNMYVADYLKDSVYKIDRLANVTTIAGTGVPGFSGDGALATAAQLNHPTSVAVDADGTVYIADYNNYRIRRIDTKGIITTFAGTGRSGFTGDNGPANNATISLPLDMVVDGSGNLLIAEYGNARIRKVTRSGIITTIAGTGRRASTGDNGPPLAADIDPAALVIGADGSIYFADSSYRGSPTGPKVRKISADGTKVTTVAGSGARGSAGDGGPALSASFLSIDGIALDSGGNLYIGEYDGARIRKVASGTNGITTYAGTAVAGLSGDGGLAIKAQFNGPVGLVVDSAGNLDVADYSNRRIRRISPPALPALSADPPQASFLGKTGFSSNTYLEIHGTNLAQTTRTWAGSDFTGANAPTTLDGVSVTVNGKPAFIYYVSPDQININTPDDTTVGPVQIQVKNALGLSGVGTVNRSRISPALQGNSQFLIGGKQYVVALTPDFLTFIGRPNMLAGVAFALATFPLKIRHLSPILP